MSLYEKDGSPNWWTRFSINGRRVQQSTGTTDKKSAAEYESKLKSSLWDEIRLGIKPKRTWKEAAVQWLKETQHKKTHASDRRKLRWLDQYLGALTLDEIKRDTLVRIAESKVKESSQPTANRYMALVRAILRKAANEWEWLGREPKVRMYKESDRRVRFLLREEADRLIDELPMHLAEMSRFALATGLRRANITGLEWTKVKLEDRLAWIDADEAKGKKSIPVPLNKDALDVLKRQVGKHPTRVFTYHSKPVFQTCTKAWHKALKRAGIENLRFHDLRHTWASWHVQSGTPIYALQEMGGWQSSEMVRRYAHFQPGTHLVAASQAIEGKSELGTKSPTARNRAPRPRVQAASNTLNLRKKLVAREGIEPPTRGFSVRCSTN